MILLLSLSLFFPMAFPACASTLRSRVIAKAGPVTFATPKPNLRFRLGEHDVATTRRGAPPMRRQPHRADILRRGAVSDGRRHVSAAGTMMILVPPHPLVKHYLGVARLDMAPPAMTKNAFAELGRILLYECIRDWLPVVTQEIKATNAMAEATFVDNTRPIQIVPIGRVAPVLLEHASTLLPASQTFHVGLTQTEGKADYYLNTLPDKFLEDEQVLLVIPEVASNEILDKVLEDVLEKGAKKENVRILTILAAPNALAPLGLKYSAVKMYCAMIDPEMDEEGRILPGLGDVERRTFG